MQKIGCTVNSKFAMEMTNHKTPRIPDAPDAAGSYIILVKVQAMSSLISLEMIGEVSP